MYGERVLTARGGRGQSLTFRPRLPYGPAGHSPCFALHRMIKALSSCGPIVLIATFGVNGSEAATVRVADGGDLQLALTNAKPGDIVELAPGATFTGNFTLPAKGGGTDVIVLRSA